ncbi:MAG TPA: 3-deoxy-D-manno-octulosonic acid transferase [Legionella sp.]|nr:3-deoxy-D-manno-octulosonic acid transferase [Legionella sp.]
MRFIYTFLLYLSVPFVLCRLYWKGRRLPAYRRRIHERFSLNNLAPTDVWLHAVSLGEVIAATPLIDALLAQKLRVLVTTMTPTGSLQVSTRFGDKVAHQYIPYDLPWALKRFFKKMNARVGIIMETELWPHLIHQATRANVPLVLANARISDKAFKHYQMMRFFFKPILAKFSSILSQSDLDATRFVALGAPVNRVHALGNMKFDLQIQVSNQVIFDQLKTAWGVSRPVVMAASTHEGEEKQLLAGLTHLKAAIPNVVLLIAPRHPERFKTVYALAEWHGFNTQLRSQPNTIDAHTDVVILDSLGELLGFYRVSDYAFVGGSLVPVGGHNVLEPIAMQVPVFCAPFMMNSKAIFAALCDAGALQCVKDIDDLWARLVAMHLKPIEHTQQIANANGVLKANQGAVLRCLDVVLACMRA